MRRFPSSLRILFPAVALVFASFLASPPSIRAQPADTPDQLEAAQEAAGVLDSSRVDARVEEIVVSARKRAEMLEDTPLAVTAIGVETLRDHDITRLDEIRNLVPNLNFQQTPVALDQAAQFRIRGIGTTRIGSSFDPGVGIYVDGVYLPRGVSSIMSVVDVEQVEVLRGPQGTLFGKNSIGGAISLTTVKAREDFEGFAQVRPGNFGLIETRSMVNVPILDNLFSRFSIATTNFDGFTFNTTRNETTSDRQSVSLLGTVRWIPTDAITVDVSGFWNRDRSHGMGASCFFVQQGPLAPPGDEWQKQCTRSGPFEYQSELLQIADQQGWGGWGIVNWDFGDAWIFEDVSLKSTTSYRGGTTALRADIDGTALPLIKIASIGGAPTASEPTSGWSAMQEIQLTATAWDGRVNAALGGFGFWENGDSAQNTSALLSGALLQSNTSRSQTDNSDWAVFAQTTVDLLDWMSLTAGVRYTQEKKENNFSVTPVLPVPGAPEFAPARAVFDAWTPMASLALTLPEDLMGDAPLDHLMGYFTYSRGFRGGGFNAVLNSSVDSLTPFEPETLDSFELGTKMIALDQRLTFNVALFLYDYRNIQVTSTEFDPSTEGIIQLTRNAAEGTGKGIELEARAFPIPGLVLNGNAGILDAKYDDFPNAVNDVTGATLNRAGEQFTNSPELQTNLGVQFTLPVQNIGPEWLAGYFTPRLDWYYQSSVIFAGPELVAAKQRGYNLLHARLAYSFDGDRAQVALWAKNLLNETYFISGQPLASTYGHVLRTYAAPRTYGGELSYRF